jgi:prepilin-type N-terminal cleavage/methylation domain-containing protein
MVQIFNLDEDYNRNSRGFTLIELAIVVVVLGILTAGALMGRSIIHSANINATVNEMNKMQTAVRAFNLEFDDIPGIMDNAYDYWGPECGTASFAQTTGCNGDLMYDKCVNNHTQNCQVTMGIAGDVRRFFIHLKFSAIHPDLPVVLDSASETNCVIGETLPSLDVGGTYFVASSRPKKLYMYLFEPRNFTHVSWTCSISAPLASIKPKDAKRIDEKIDDGNGRRGYLKAILDLNGNTYLSSDCMDSSGNYNLSSEEKDCGLRFELQ